MRVCKRVEPAAVGGLMDRLRTDFMGSRSPPPLIITVTAVCIRQVEAVLSVDTQKTKWLGNNKA